MQRTGLADGSAEDSSTLVCCGVFRVAAWARGLRGWASCFADPTYHEVLRAAGVERWRRAHGRSAARGHCFTVLTCCRSLRCAVGWRHWAWAEGLGGWATAPSRCPCLMCRCLRGAPDLLPPPAAGACVLALQWWGRGRGAWCVQGPCLVATSCWRCLRAGAVAGRCGQQWRSMGARRCPW